MAAARTTAPSSAWKTRLTVADGGRRLSPMKPLARDRDRPLRRAGVAVIVLMCAMPAGLRAQTANPNLWVTDGAVNAIASSGGTIFLGASLSAVRPATGACVPVDLATGTPNLSFPRIVGKVYAVAEDGSGGW